MSTYMKALRRLEHDGQMTPSAIPARRRAVREAEEVSVRQPAALCGIVGHKPTYGRVSRSGLVAFASSLDQVGPLARSTEDAAALQAAVEGPDPADATTRSLPALLGAPLDLAGLRVGIVEELEGGGDGFDPEVAAAVARAREALARRGARLVRQSLPHCDGAFGPGRSANRAADRWRPP